MGYNENYVPGVFVYFMVAQGWPFLYLENSTQDEIYLSPATSQWSRGLPFAHFTLETNEESEMLLMSIHCNGMKKGNLDLHFLVVYIAWCIYQNLVVWIARGVDCNDVSVYHVRLNISLECTSFVSVTQQEETDKPMNSRNLDMHRPRHEINDDICLARERCI